MKELRATAEAYYNSCDERHKEPVKRFFTEMDSDSNLVICFEEFKSHMRKVNCAQFGTRVFFDKLRGNKKEYLSYEDVVTLFYIIYSGRPFCEECKAFVEGIYFTCVQCFEVESDYSFNVCPSCFNASSYRHSHKQFMDPFALLRLKRKQYQYKAPPKPSNPRTSSSRKAETNPRGSMEVVGMPNPQRKTPSGSNAGTYSSRSAEIKPGSSKEIVPMRNLPRNTVRPQRNTVMPDKALQLIQLAVAVGNILVTAQFCTIM